MKITQKLRTAVIVTAATILLAGCATAQPKADNSGGEALQPSPSATITEQPQAEQPADGEAAFTEKASTEDLGITVIEVIDPRTFVVGPRTNEQERYGYTGQMTVTLFPSLNLVTPAEGECGYEQTLAFAKQYFAENPEGDAFVGAGSFASIEYYSAAIQAGVAYTTDTEGIFRYLQGQAESDQPGLWTTCPGFGK